MEKNNISRRQSFFEKKNKVGFLSVFSGSGPHAIYGIRKEQFSGYSITKRYVNSSKYVGISVITFFHLYLRYKKLA